MQPYELTLAAAARQIRARALSPVELTESVLARIDEVDPHITAFSNVTAELATETAARAEQEIAVGRYRGPLHGIPIGVKEIYDMAGIPSTSSSRVRADYRPDADSVVVAKLREAGAVVVGRTHSHEFAYGVVTPQTRNPWRADRIAGGSSGGSAAAVAVGACFLGLGSDTAGSIRIPAALCGTVGLKPSYGRVSRTGVTPFAESLDHAGPLRRDMQSVLGESVREPGNVADPGRPAGYHAGTRNGPGDVVSGVFGDACVVVVHDGAGERTNDRPLLLGGRLVRSRGRGAAGPKAHQHRSDRRTRQGLV